ncbi:MAG TPA: hypothetical protein VF618_27495 [Thermoanaerobaculia bacterium]
MPLGDLLTDTMTRILADAQQLVRAVESDPSLPDEDREAVLRSISHITAQADLILQWLEDAPLHEQRN